MSKLWQSRKFWVMLWDFIVCITLFFVAKYALPTIAEDIQFLIGALQAPVLFIIAAIAYEDGEAYRAGVHPANLALYDNVDRFNAYLETQENVEKPAVDA